MSGLRRSISRRRFLAAGAAAGVGLAIDHVAGGPPGSAFAAGAAQNDAGSDALAEGLQTRIPFEGAHQAGVLTPSQAHAVFASFDAITESRAELAKAIESLSVRARRLTAGYAALIGAPDGEGPTPDSGILGTQPPPDALTVTVGFGASLFDDRFGLARRKPKGLTPMRTFPDDALVPGECHGDLMLQLRANTEETLLNALRDLMRETRGVLALRWKIEGYQTAKREQGASRNLLGFKDGTANPDTTDDDLMRELVWTGDDQPRWAQGGTFQVVRIIRNRVEFWDRVARNEQELMIGRDKVIGAPLGKPRELDDPDYPTDAKGDRIPLDAHIRLARPRTKATESERILRRGYNYSRGVDQSGQLDMGLVFAAFNRNIQRQFEAVQTRLNGEPLIDYVKPTGGGYFFVPPGAQDPDDWVGSGLFA
ncbi:MAG: iron uptake transporter deferrochelatase/peroxidase subunit [Solirubrobacterales bacterium]